MNSITAEELKQWEDSKKEYFILDVREQWEYDLVRIPNAVLVPLGLLQSRPPEIDKEQAIVVYCHHGRRSKMGCHILESQGFRNTHNLTGGIDSYADVTDPKMEKY